MEVRDTSSICSKRQRADDTGREIMVQIKDPIHGSVELHPLLYKIINTEEFNRLKFIRQLGGVFYVYPGATHTRFEHSIGVCHLAGKFIRMLKEKQPNLNITDKEVLCVEIAGLCHDLGHGPFSHVFDKSILNECRKKGESKIRHEEISLHILDDIYQKRLKNEFDDAFEEDASNYVEIIKKMIHPIYTKDIELFMRAERDRYFLYQIVANKETGIDVDKWDYFWRDCHYMGIPHDFDWKRLMQLSRVINVQEKDVSGEFSCNKICFNRKEISNIIGMFRTRFNLHQKAYQHKSVLAIEERVSTALLKVKDEPLVFGLDCCGVEGSTKLSLSAIHKLLKMKPANVSGYLALTDDIVHIVMHKATSEITNCKDAETNLREASKLLRDLFYRRKKFHLVKKFNMVPDTAGCADFNFLDCQKLQSGIAEKFKSDKDHIKFNEDFILCKNVEFSFFSESKRKERPKILLQPMDTSLAEIHFFSKSAPDEAKTLTEEQLCEQFIPRKFESRQVWLYSGHDQNELDDNTLIKAAEEVRKSC